MDLQALQAPWAGAWAAAEPLAPPPAPLTLPVTHNVELSSEDEQAALLPRGAVVLIRGNARTRQSLIGQRAVVRRAVGLGGWHWLVLPSGEEVKLQRNALEVLERPTAGEMDMSEEEEEEQRRREQQQSVARGYVYEPAEPHAEDRPRPPRRPSSVPPQQRSFLEEYSQGGRARVHSSRGGGGGPRINLGKLQTASLKRYGAAYHLVRLLESQPPSLLFACCALAVMESCPAPCMHARLITTTALPNHPCSRQRSRLRPPESSCWMLLRSTLPRSR
jgi:hypothetical protein